MCTNFALINTKGVAVLADHLSVNAADFIFSEHHRPGSRISIITEGKAGRRVTPALWWLYLQQTPEGLKPHKDYFSVNTNYKKLEKKHEYRHSRCIVPATSFFESQDGKNPHELKPADGSCMAFGGLYKEWMDKTTGELVTSASVITLAGIKPLENIHRKSVPLWLPEAAYDAWLSPEVTNTEELNYLLEPVLRTSLLATPIDRVSTRKSIGDSFLLPAT